MGGSRTILAVVFLPVVVLVFLPPPRVSSSVTALAFAFAPPPAHHRRSYAHSSHHRRSAVGGGSSLGYGNDNDNDNSNDDDDNNINNNNNNGHHRADFGGCPVEDEDCRALSSLIRTSTAAEAGRDSSSKSSSSLSSSFSSSSSSSSSSRAAAAVDDNDDADVYCGPIDVDCRAFFVVRSSEGRDEHEHESRDYDDDDDDDCCLRDNDATLAADLARRIEAVRSARVEDNWREARCPASLVVVATTTTTNVNATAAAAADVRVRRVCVGAWPIVACGTSGGDVIALDLEDYDDYDVDGTMGGRVMGCAVGAHRSSSSSSSSGRTMTMREEERRYDHGRVVDDDDDDGTMTRLLYGGLDGGGVISVAMRGNVIASSGREGGARLWRVVRRRGRRRDDDVGVDDVVASSSTTTTTTATTTTATTTGDLVPLFSLPGLGGTVVTRLAFDVGGLLWTSCYDGTVRAYNVSSIYDDDDDDDDLPRPPGAPIFWSDFTDSVLDMNLCDELKLGVCATADGGAALFDMTDGQFFVGIMPFEASISARSVLVVRRRDGMGHAVLCGGSDGTIHCLPLNVDPDTGKVDREYPFGDASACTAISPNHVGPVMCMTSPGDGRFVSGGQDGSLRVWDFAETEDGKIETKCMYALTGYKPWLGSACTDGKRLISDGGGNSIVIRDFSREPPGKF